MDIWSKEKRSEVMARIRGKDTKPELVLRSILFRLGFRFRVHVKNLPGRPDIVLPKYKTVILVHGCFWHYHSDCNEGKIPRSNSIFWRQKLERNVMKDERNTIALQQLGWKVIVIWECEIEKKLETAILKIQKSLKRKRL